MSVAERRTITRHREMLACTECRRKKLKCDRNTPCNTCVKRGNEAACRYQRYASGVEKERERRVEAEARLMHLEQLVQQLAQPRNAHIGCDPSTSAIFQSSVPEENGQANGGVPATLYEDLAYKGSTHWSAMLEDIQELRFAIATDDPTQITQDQQNMTDDDAGVGILFGSETGISLSQTLDQYLPSRQDADRLTAAYFRSRAVAAPFIHAPQFQRLYQAFWESPYKAPPLWTSIFFSICRIATFLVSPQEGNFAAAAKFSLAAAHCIAVGKYYNPKPLSVESMLLFAQSKMFTSLDIQPDVGTIMGLVIRLATRMGYHRDPDIFNMSPFDKEMRRRTWSLCIQLDLLVSFQLGLPSNIQYPTWDTRPPGNLLDSDFDEDVRIMPSPRPESELTGILFYIAKHKLVAVFEKALRHALATRIAESAEVDELDAEARSTYASLPVVMRPRLISESIVDPPYLVVTRLCTYFMYQKILCVLHRKHVVGGRAKSIQICYESSLDLLRRFLDAYDGFRPGGQYEDESWFMSSITWNDYLLGAMALCLVLCVTSQNRYGTSVNLASTLDLLHKSRLVCLEQSTRSKDTRRVGKLIVATISRFGPQNGHGWSSNGVDLSVNKLGPSAVPLSYAGDQNVGQGLDATNGAHETSGFPTESAWHWDEDPGMPVDDASWQYLEQFLSLSSIDPLVDL